MNKRNAILNHPVFRQCCREIATEEQGRIFCRHDMAHLLDVARLMMILNEKESLGIDEEIIYAAALVHDVGRHIQYRYGIGHEISGALIAPGILRDCGFSQTEVRTIVQAVMRHRSRAAKQEKNLSGLLYRADKMSRSCFACPAENLCSWPADKKNLVIKY